VGAGLEQAGQRCLQLTAARAARYATVGRGWVFWVGMFAVVLAGTQSYAQTDAQVLAQSVLSYHFHTAPLAPIYLSEYEITVKPDRSVRLWYRFGPGNSQAPSGSAAGITHTFKLDEKPYRELIETLERAGVLAGNWTPSATLIGSSQETVSIREPSGKKISISSALQPEARATFQIIVDAMRATVPESSWLTKDREQKAYQDSAR